MLRPIVAAVSLEIAFVPEAQYGWYSQRGEVIAPDLDDRFSCRRLSQLGKAWAADFHESARFSGGDSSPESRANGVTHSRKKNK